MLSRIKKMKKTFALKGLFQTFYDENFKRKKL